MLNKKAEPRASEKNGKLYKLKIQPSRRNIMQLSREINPLVVNIFLAKPNSSLTNRQIQKILFKLKQELPENEHLQRVLPYYWFTYGPFSEPVANSIKQMTRIELIKQIDADGIKLLELNDSKIPPNARESIEPEILDALETMLAHYDASRPQLLIDEVYNVYAPRKFQRLYSIDFYRALQQYIKAKKTEKILSLEDVLYKCEAALPLEPFFERFNEQFSLFVSYTPLLFDQAQDAGGNVSFGFTEKVASNLWQRFAEGVRILPDAHNEFYENKLPRWLTSFNREVSEKLSPKLDEYSFQVKKCTTSKPYTHLASFTA